MIVLEKASTDICAAEPAHGLVPLQAIRDVIVEAEFLLPQLLFDLLQILRVHLRVQQIIA